jgi:hypothetical protein
MALYEPPGPPTVPADWLRRLHSTIDAGQSGLAVASFLIEVIGLTRERVNELRDQALRAGSGPGVEDVLAVASPGSEIVVLDGEGHEGVDGAPRRVLDELLGFTTKG